MPVGVCGGSDGKQMHLGIVTAGWFLHLKPSSSLFYSLLSSTDQTPRLALVVPFLGWTPRGKDQEMRLGRCGKRLYSDCSYFLNSYKLFIFEKEGEKSDINRLNIAHGFFWQLLAHVWAQALTHCLYINEEYERLSAGTNTGSMDFRLCHDSLKGFQKKEISIFQNTF